MQGKLTDNDKLIMYLQGELSHSDLSKPQQYKLERIFYCKDLIYQHSQKHKVVQMMMSVFKRKYAEEGKSYSRRTALNDYSATEEVFGRTTKHNRDFHVDMLLHKLEKTRYLAEVTQNATALARCDANHAQIIEKFMGDKDTPDYTNLQIPVQVFGFNPQWLEVYKSGKLPDDEELLEEIELLEKVEDKRKLKFNPGKVELAKIVEEYGKEGGNSSDG